MAIEKDILLSASKAKGKRPYFLDDQMAERALSVAMALANELSVSQERVATLEQILCDKGVINENSIDEFSPTADQLAARGLRQQALINRVLRLIQQDVQGVSQQADEMSCEEIASTVDQA